MNKILPQITVKQEIEQNQINVKTEKIFLGIFIKISYLLDGMKTRQSLYRGTQVSWKKKLKESDMLFYDTCCVKKISEVRTFKKNENP